MEQVEILRNPDVPQQITLELTSRCNLKCIMCPLTAGTSSTASPTLAWDYPALESMILGLEGIERVNLTGFGEPMLHADLIRVIDLLDQRGLQWNLTTNAVAVPAAFLDRLPRLRSFTHLNISVDTLSPDLYRRVRGGLLEKVLRNIGKIASTAGSATSVSVSCVLMKSTIHDAPRWPRILRGLGVRQLVLQSLHDQLQGGLGEHISEVPDRALAFVRLQEAAEAEGVKLLLEMPERTELELRDPAAAVRVYLGDCTRHAQSRACNVPWEAPHIDAAGRVFPCCRAAALNQEQVGDLREREFAAIWNGDALRDFRSRLGDPQRTPRVCRRCSAAPAGTPAPLRYSAKVVGTAERPGSRRQWLTVLNTGAEAWQGQDVPRLGMCAPRDRVSPNARSSWLSPNRIGGPAEACVIPGEVAHFPLPEAEPGKTISEVMQLVVDGHGWLPGTRITATVRTEAPPYSCLPGVDDVFMGVTPRRGWHERESDGRNVWRWTHPEFAIDCAAEGGLLSVAYSLDDSAIPVTLRLQCGEYVSELVLAPGRSSAAADLSRLAPRGGTIQGKIRRFQPHNEDARELGLMVHSIRHLHPLEVDAMKRDQATSRIPELLSGAS